MKDYITSPFPAHPAQVSSLVEQEWGQVVKRLPADLEETARTEQALRRCREVRSAADLLRLIFAYVLCDWPLRLVGAWAMLTGLGNLSDVAVLNRLRSARRWLGKLLLTSLLGQSLELATPRVQLRLVDATTVQHPGSSGTDWRVHLSLNMQQLRFDAVELTDVHGGETLARFPFQPGEILVADRGYARRPGMASALATGSSMVVRIGWRMPLHDQSGEVFDLVPWLRTVPLTQPLQRAVLLKTPNDVYPLRLIACRLPQQAVEAARRRTRRRSNRKGQTPRRETLQAAAFFMVVTNLPEETWPIQDVLQLYRIRWQVEVAIKRLKSIWHLDHLRAKDMDLAQTYLLGKLLGALLSDRLTGEVRACLPEWFGELFRPVSLWRLQRIWFDWVQRAVAGWIPLEVILKALPRLQRYLLDSPRKKRRQQLAYVLAWFQVLNGVDNGEAPLAISAIGEYEMVQS
jgi:hypothetical protein